MFSDVFKFAFKIFPLSFRNSIFRRGRPEKGKEKRGSFAGNFFYFRDQLSDLVTSRIIQILKLAFVLSSLKISYVEILLIVKCLLYIHLHGHDE
jgi:hypothetical protein